LHVLQDEGIHENDSTLVQAERPMSSQIRAQIQASIDRLLGSKLDQATLVGAYMKIDRDPIKRWSLNWKFM
jgi:hypothetical protein